MRMFKGQSADQVRQSLKLIRQGHDVDYICLERRETEYMFDMARAITGRVLRHQNFHAAVRDPQSGGTLHFRELRHIDHKACQGRRPLVMVDHRIPRNNMEKISGRNGERDKVVWAYNIYLMQMICRQRPSSAAISYSFDSFLVEPTEPTVYPEVANTQIIERKSS